LEKETICSVFTSDLKHGEQVARKISTGMVFVNHPTMIKADIPFGGIRNLGYMAVSCSTSV
jgi:succinate-semialdehyde dehydrogenase/glutarate-semialdehyde dehydrogenase